ncbi:MAG: NADPH-dependent oxidoreductase [Leptolyngbya sp. PLA3]|nr:MAG: NADPH-dependent oxidoreductase [Cyanobacteria bacterium CYA]MCE7968679.1 NADPH-dependent oxidoreductase [Leptolyngbya sp. PL-A3]
MTYRVLMNEVIKLLLSHRSIRRFADQVIPEQHVEACVRAGQMASTSSAVQAYACIRIKDPGRRRALADLAGPQEKVSRAPEFFVICGDARRHRLLCERAGVDYDQRMEGFLISVIDATLFAQNMVIAFESLGYGVCYTGGIRNDLPGVGRVLGLPQGVYPLYGLCVGVPAEIPAPRPRLPTEAVLFDDGYPTDEDVLASIDRFDATYRDYLAKRGATARGWGESIIEKMGHASRVSVGPYYRDQGAVMA